MPYSQILGHDRQKQLLSKALSADRLASAYLFSGPEGVGKKLLAKAFIKNLFCVNGNSCGHCRSCRQFEEGNHPDFIFLDGTPSTIKIDDIRAVQKGLHFRPAEADHRVCLIDGAEKMTHAAQTALLKSLEEPKLHTMFILVSANAEALLPTIRSRCQNLKFNRLPVEALRGKFSQTLEEDQNHAALLAALADGSFKNSLSDKRDFYLQERPEILQDFTRLPLLESHVDAYFTLAGKLAAKKNLIPDILEVFKLFFRDTLFELQGRPESDFVNADLAGLVRHQSSKESIASTLKKLEAIRDIEDSINKNTNPQLSFEVLLMRLSDQPSSAASNRTV
ncbi:MAG: DNA polymerase III subunit delta' [Deltaproteobacteria bacterium]|nr:DNA polymerase III subunit delta' [Deltaproteobacteria bacterium]